MKKTTTKKAPIQKGKSNGKHENGSSPDSALKELFVDGIKDLYWAEKHLLKALPKMAKATTSNELQGAFETHLEQTREHVTKLEEIFELLGEKAQAKKCEAMEGLTKESESMIEETEDETMTRDVALIMAAQKVEHYEIASYGSLAQLAKTMGMTKAKDILGGILDQEKETDEILTKIAEGWVNEEASVEHA